MMEPRPEQFHGGVPVAMYRCVAPAVVKVRGATEARQCAAGEIVAAVGLPDTALAPVNAEAVYAKRCAVNRVVRQGFVDNLDLLAVSLGAAPLLPRAEAWAWVTAWLRDPQLRTSHLKRTRHD